MTPAAVLSILVKTTGSEAAMAQLAKFDGAAKASSKSSTGLAAAQSRGQAAFKALSRSAEKAAADVTRLEFAQKKAALAVEKAKLAEATAIQKSGAESLRARTATLQLASAEERLAQTTSQLSAAQGRSAAAQKELGASQKASSVNMAGVSRAAGYTALAVGAIGVASVKAAATFEQQMNTLQSVSQASGSEMKQLSDLSKKLGADVKLPGTSAQDAAEAMTEMIKAGVSIKDTMAGTRDVLVLSAAAQIDNARAAEIASNALNTFKLRGQDVKFVTDELANTANASSVEITDVADSLKMAGAVFSSFQAPVLGAKGAMHELNVAIGLLGNAGIKGSDAGTSLKQSLLQLSGPSDRAKGAMRALYVASQDNSVSESKLATALRGTGKERSAAIKGLEAQAGATLKGGDIAYTATGKMRSFHQIIGLVAKGTRNMTQEQKQAYITQIFGADAVRTVLALIKAGPKEWDKMSKAVSRQGAAQDLANAKMKGFKGSVDSLKSTLETLAITLGEPLLGPLATLVRGFASLLSSVDPAVIGAVTAAVGTFALALWGAAKAQAAWNVMADANPYVLIAAALIALGIALVVAYKKSETFRNIVNGVWDAIKTGATAAAGVIVPVAKAIWNVLKDAGAAIASAWGPAVGAVKTAFAALQTAFQAVKGFVSGVVNAVVTEVGKWKVLGFIVSTYLKLMSAQFMFVFAAIKAIVKVGVAALWPIVKTSLDVILGVIRVWASVTGALFRTIWGVVKAVFSGAWTALKGIVTGGLRVLHGVIQVIGGIFKGDFHQIWEGIKNIFTGQLKIVKGILTGAIKTLTGAGKAIGAGIKDGITGALSGVVGLVTGFMNDIIGVVNSVLGFLHLTKIPPIGGSKGGKTPSRANPAGDRAGGQTGLARGGAFARTNGMVNHPITLMGEEAPRHPEFVIPTNPAYRKRAQGLLAQAAGQIGFKDGGFWGAVKSAGSALRTLAPLSPLGYAATGAASAASFIKDLPGTGELPSWIKGVGGYTLDKVKKWIKDKVGLGGGVPGGTTGSVRGAMALAREMGLAITSTTGGRHAKNSWHYKGRAADVAGDPGQMAQFFRAAYKRYGSHLLELFYDPIGFYVKNGQKVQGAIGEHSDHVHIALAQGGYFGKYANRVTVKGSKADKEQRGILGRALELADQWNVPYKAKLALIEALIVESEARNLKSASGDGFGSYGVLQGREKYHKRSDLLDPDYQIGVFLGRGRGGKKNPKGFTGRGSASALAKRGGMTAGQIAQAVEGSAYPSRYGQHAKEAAKIIRVFSASKKSGGKAKGRKITKAPVKAKKNPTMTEKWQKIWDAMPEVKFGKHLENMWLLAQETPSFTDDLQTAAQGYYNADRMVQLAAGYAKNGTPGAFEWLSAAQSARSDWLSKYTQVRDDHKDMPLVSVPTAIRDVVEPAYTASKAADLAAGGGTGDNEWQAAIKQLAADMRTQTLRGQAIEKMEPDKLVIAWMQELATGRLGTSAALAAQSPSSPGVVAGGFR